MSKPTLDSVDGISAIFFDAGDTLVRPASGHWYIPPRFYEILESYQMPTPDQPEVCAALEAGFPYLEANHSIETEKEEAGQFAEYYRIVFSHLGAARPQDGCLRALAEDMVYNDDKYIFFPDTLKSITRLHGMDIPLGVLSNTWPSLERVFEHAGVLDLFKVFVISSRVGCFKPDARIYADAIARIDVEPSRTLFVDDSEQNLAGGVTAGMRPLLIHRYSHCSDSHYPCITGLTELAAGIKPRF